jgi:hypothetical protein
MFKARLSAGLLGLLFLFGADELIYGQNLPPQFGFRLSPAVLAQSANQPGDDSKTENKENEVQRTRRRLSPPLRIALGFLVPGLPQYLDRQWRSYGYFALEGASIAGIIILNSQGSSRKERFHNLAVLARKNFVYPGLRTNSEERTDPMPLGFGEYYEDLKKWPSSGDYDNDPSQSGIQPETDQRTYNGHQWRIAQINKYTKTSGGLPVPANPAEVDQAVDAYSRAVYPLEYNWDWTGLEREKAEYDHVFAKSDDALRRRSTFALLLFANHLLSGLDVLLSEKLNRTRALQAAGLEMHLELRRPQAAPRYAVCPAMIFSRQF